MISAVTMEIRAWKLKPSLLANQHRSATASFVNLNWLFKLAGEGRKSTAQLHLLGMCTEGVASTVQTSEEGEKKKFRRENSSQTRSSWSRAWVPGWLVSNSAELLHTQSGSPWVQQINLLLTLLDGVFPTCLFSRHSSWPSFLTANFHLVPDALVDHNFAHMLHLH